MPPNHKLNKKKIETIQEATADFIDNLPLVISALASFLSKRSSTTKDALTIFYITKFNSPNSSIWDTLNILTMTIYEVIFKNKNVATSILAAIRIIKYIQKDIPNLIYHLTALSETKKKIDLDYIYSLSEHIEKIVDINKEARQKAEKSGSILYNSSNKDKDKEIDFLSINGIIPNSNYILLNRKIKDLAAEYKKKKDIISKININNPNFDLEYYDKIQSEANSIYIELINLQKKSHETYKEMQIPILEPIKNVRKAFMEATKTVNIIDPKYNNKNKNNDNKNKNKNNNNNNNNNNNKNNNNNNNKNNNKNNNNNNNNNNKNKNKNK